MTKVITYDQSANVRLPGFEPIIDFAEGRLYSQVDLDSRYAVEALAKYYKNGDGGVFYSGGYTQDLALELEKRRAADAKSLTVFVREDSLGDEVASIFVSQ